MMGVCLVGMAYVTGKVAKMCWDDALTNHLVEQAKITQDLTEKELLHARLRVLELRVSNFEDMLR